MSQQQPPDHDDLAEQFALNDILKSSALDCATYFLSQSSARLRLNPEFTGTPIILAAHALIAHNEWMHYQDRDRLNVIADKLECLVESLNSIVESIDCAGATMPDFWMTSDVAAKEKAELLGLSIPPEWTMADLRYKLHQAIYGGENG